MNFDSLPAGLEARLNGARAHARARIQAAKFVAEQAIAAGRQEASQAPNERFAAEILNDRLREAVRDAQHECESAACELLAELIAIRLEAGDDPAQLARELEAGVPASIQHEMDLVVPWSSSLEGVLAVAIVGQCEKCWKQAQESASSPEPARKRRRGRGVPPDVMDHARVAAACEKYGDGWRFHLVEICDELARTDAKFPKSFKEQDEFENWMEVAENLRNAQNQSIKQRFTKYLQYRLNQVRKKLT